MTYKNIDEIITNCAKRKGLKIEYDSSGSKQRRFCYIFSESGHCFQIVVEPEIDGQVRVDVHLIESPTDSEVHYIWETPANRLRQKLDAAVSEIQRYLAEHELR